MYETISSYIKWSARIGPEFTVNFVYIWLEELANTNDKLMLSETMMDKVKLKLTELMSEAEEICEK